MGFGRSYSRSEKSSAGIRYDHQTVQVMFRVLRRDSNCVDIGAHCGDILRHMVNIAPKGRHIAFEPIPILAAGLRDTYPEVTIHELAVSDTSGEAEFLFVENDPAYSGLRRRIYDRDDPQISLIRVHLTTLDEMIPADHKISFIKIDIEGGEYHALKGSVETLRRSTPVIVFEAGTRSTGQYGVSPDDLYSLLSEAYGYDVSTMQRWLRHQRPFYREEFREVWNKCSDYYFLGSPRT